MIRKTAIKGLAFIAVGAAAVVSLAALTGAIDASPSSETAELQEVASYPVPAGIKSDRLASARVPSVETDPDRSSPLDPAPALSGSQPMERDDSSSNVKSFDDKPFTKPAVMASMNQSAPQTRSKPASIKPTNVLLNDAQIAQLKERLKLSPSQQRYWPEIESALRGVLKQIYEANKRARGATVPLNMETPEVERLKTAAIPLLTQLRPDQKAEVLALARIIGMEKMMVML